MGSSSACDECGKKFKVFGLKRKCKHCMDVMCKNCLTEHLEVKHTHSNRSSRGRMSLDTLDTTRDNTRLQYMSSTRFTDLDVEFADQKHSLNGVDAIEAVSDEEDDDLLDYDDDELSITTLSRQSSIEELELRYMEMHKMQAAVATWAMKEKQAKMEMKLKKMNSYCPMSPVFQEGCEYENCNMFVVSYAIVATILVWAVYGVLLFLYFHTRTNLAYVY